MPGERVLLSILPGKITVLVFLPTEIIVLGYTALGRAAMGLLPGILAVFAVAVEQQY